MVSYEEMLKRGRTNLPEKALKTERFEMPKAKGHVQGSKTIITNFSDIASTFRRPQEHLLKYLQRELATPAQIDGPRLVLGRVINSTLVNSKLDQYAKNFVLCSQCGKPDTEIKKEDKVQVLKCQACGARHPIKAKI